MTGGERIIAPRFIRRLFMLLPLGFIIQVYAIPNFYPDIFQLVLKLSFLEFVVYDTY